MSKADIVHSWFAQRLGSSGPLSRDTDAYNQVVDALPDLIAQLDGLDAPAADPADDTTPTPPEPATGQQG